MSETSSAAGTRHSAAEQSDHVIRIRGARVHNLKNIDVDIPRNRFVVLTGPSGSGKSSLAFDTLYAEGQRHYIESLSVYARQFLHQLERPDVDLIEGLQPTISIDQRAGSRNPRSTVATVTEVYDHLRLLMARIGQPHCFQCNTPIRQQSLEQIQNRLLDLQEGTKAILLAPLVRGRKGRQTEALAAVRKAGFVRIRVDGQIFEIDATPPLDAGRRHNVDAVVDRIVVRPGVRSRLGESIKLAVQMGEGRMIVSHQESSADSRSPGEWQDQLFSTLFACPKCETSFEELEPRSFSFNSPYGACADCEGLGCSSQFDPELLIPDLELSLGEGAIAPWRSASPAKTRKLKDDLHDFLEIQNVGWDTPLSSWSAQILQLFLDGDNDNFPGVRILLEKEYVTTTKPSRLDQLERFRNKITCHACNGSRLRPEARSVRLGGRTIHEITSLAVNDARQFFESIDLETSQRQIAKPILAEIVHRLRFLDNVGVDYLTLDRAADTLSGGEFQRVRLATSIGSGLVGVCYILDEPSIGLHQRDNQKLINALRDLQQQGNTVLVVEHDEAMMRAADHLIDMGPAAGVSGGQVVSQGSPNVVGSDSRSLTGRYLSGELQIPVPQQRRRAVKARSISLTGVSTNNLQGVDVWFPLGVFVCLTGVSGSGKSSLLNETLVPAVQLRLGGTAFKPGPYETLRGIGQIDKLVNIDQSPVGRTPRSSAATYTGMFDEIRKVFKTTREARQRGYGVGRFSFNVKGGRCEDCQGQGVRKIEMNFLPDLYVPCGTCHGSRFNRQTLQVRYRGKTIADVLGMRVADAADFFQDHPVLHRSLNSMLDIGLGYLALGQPSTTLSGGEAQRIKLATELSRPATGQTLYLLDEPTSGLHTDDIKRLLNVLDRLVELGNTVVVIEHNLDVIKCADWIVDLGPEGGSAGGRIVASGHPEEIAKNDGSHTGKLLRPLLKTS